MNFSFLGAAIGILLVVMEYMVPGGGKGGQPASVLAIGVLYFVPVIGPGLTMIAPPILWGIYCGSLGRIREYAVRWIVTLAILGLHIGPWLYFRRYAPNLVTHWTQLNPTLKMEYCIVAAGMILVLLDVWTGRSASEGNVDYRKRADQDEVD